MMMLARNCPFQKRALVAEEVEDEAEVEAQEVVEDAQEIEIAKVVGAEEVEEVVVTP